jgi:preprotein translocase SecE subunit
MAVREANPGLVRFAQESWAELRKVTWPDRETVIRLTVLVIAVSVVVGAYILGADQVFTFVVNHGILNQPGATPTPPALP